MAIPVITFSNNRDEISTVLDCVVTFSVDSNFIEFEARATLEGESYGRGIGELVMNMSIALPNYYPANSNYSFVITDQNLTLGDGVYRISMYAKNTDGIWSDAVAFEWDGASNKAGWDAGLWT